MHQPPIDYSRKWHVMTAVAMGVFLSTIDSSIVNVALPTLARDLQADFATVQWVVLAYLLTLATLMLGIGRLADMKGKKPIYTIGFIVFTIGSVLCGLSPSVHWLIGFRVLQAIGAAMIMALGAAILTEAFPPFERGKALGIFGTVVSVGIVVGPTLGGVIIDAFSWHAIFFVNLPVGILGTFLSMRFVPAFRPPGGQRFDAWGAIALCANLLCLSLALTVGQRLGFGDTRIVALFAGFAASLAIFIAVELRAEQPMIDLRLFRNRLLSVNLITGFFAFIAVAGSLILMPFYLENVMRLDTRQVGLMLAALPVGLGIVAPVSGWLSDRLGTRPIAVVGLAVLVVGYLMLSRLSAETDTLGFLVSFLPIGLGMGIFQSPNNSAIMGSAPRERLGVVSGLLSITRTLGQTTGIAVWGAVWAGRVFALTGAPLPGGATSAPPAIQVAALRDTYVGIVILIAAALGLGIWGLMHERRQQAEATMSPEPSL
jgi:EmrB/QacA subfamily drug resistance transporter